MLGSTKTWHVEHMQTPPHSRDDSVDSVLQGRRHHRGSGGHGDFFCSPWAEMKITFGIYVRSSIVACRCFILAKPPVRAIRDTGKCPVRAQLGSTAANRANSLPEL